jgi:hypothetical protein
MGETRNKRYLREAGNLILISKTSLQNHHLF